MRNHENMIKLKYLYSELKKIKITNAAKKPALECLIDKINDLDAYYAGLALTASEGGKISSKSLYNIEELSKSLKQISANDQEDIALLDECWSFLKIISQIDSILRAMA